MADEVMGLNALNPDALRRAAWEGKMRRDSLQPSAFPGTSAVDRPKLTQEQVLKSEIGHLKERLRLAIRVLNGEVDYNDFEEDD